MMKLYILLLSVFMVLSFSCKYADVSPQSNDLKDVAPFKVGVALNMYLLPNQQYKSTVLNEFNSITPESCMKFKQVHPARNVYSFSDADTLMAFAQAHNMRVHGHNLIWGLYYPQWLIDFQGDSAQWRSLMKEHIQTVIKHFGNTIDSWDVVNEALYKDGTPPASGKWINLWYAHLGINFIAEAFQDAREANATMKLFFNETELEKNDTKVNALVNMVNKFKANHIPIDGIGMEMHININTDTAGIRNALHKVAQTGLLVHISELDISLSQTAGFEADNSAYNSRCQQAALYNFMVRVYKEEVPAKQRYGITIWGVNDGNSWLPKANNNKDQPLLFNDLFQKKDTYSKFKDALK